MKYLTRSFFYGSCPLVKLLLGFSWMGKVWGGGGDCLSKRGVVCGNSVFRTESVDGKQRKDFYVVSYSDEPCHEMVIFLYVPLENGGGGGGGGRSEHVSRVVYETLK